MLIIGVNPLITQKGSDAPHFFTEKLIEAWCAHCSRGGSPGTESKCVAQIAVAVTALAAISCRRAARLR
jgi:hypothetical protein